MAGKTDTSPYHGHTRAYLAGFMAAVALFAFTTWLALQHKGMMGWEIAFFNAVNGMSESLRLVGLAATVTPESMLIGVVAVIIAFLLRLYRLVWRMAVGIFAGYFITILAKHIISRPRPNGVLEDVTLRAQEASMGFPSGHTMIVTIIVLLLIPYVTPKWRWLIPVPIILMGWSRIYLGVHAPLDIIGGFAVGLGVVCFLRVLPQAIKVFTRLD